MPRVLQPGGGGGMMRVRYTARRKRGLVAASKRGRSRSPGLDKILRSKKKVALTGPSSQLKAIEDGLMRYIFEKREQEIEINVFTVVLRASFMSPEFREKSFTARCSCVKRFMHAHSFSYRMGTHTLQRPPAEVEGEAFYFMRFVRVIVSGGNHDRRFIMNMDQTPVYFSMSSKRTLELIEKKTSTFAYRRMIRSV
jgi:hypothetical protein